MNKSQRDPETDQKQRTIDPMARLVTILAFFCALFCQGLAHDPNLSSVLIDLTPGSSSIKVVVRADKIGTKADETIRSRMIVWVDGRRLDPTTAKVSIDKAATELTWTAPFDPTGTAFDIRGKIFSEDPSARTVVSIFRNGELLQSAVHEKADALLTFGEAKGQGTLGIVAEFFRQGVEHIFLGFDHICFVLGLLLLGGTTWRIVKTVTAFTLAHSITLSVAATGLWVPPSRFIEPLIALSIVAIAAENIWNLRKPAEERNLNWRPWLAFGFGLIHGFGFAGALAEVGLPQGALGWALASFNVGVEAGQAAIVILVAPLLAILAAKRPKVGRPIIAWGSAAIGLLGMFWFVQRVVG